MHHLIWFSLGIILITGCQSSSGVRDAQSGDYLPLQQATLVLHQAVTVPPGKARVFFQSGGIVGPRGTGRGRYDLYQPHCALEIDIVDHDGFVVEPGILAVTDVQRSVTSVVMRERVLASNTAWFGSPFRNNNDRYHEGYHFWLASSEQPMVRRLSCFGVYALPIDLYPPTLGEINAALGDVATLGGAIPGEW